MKTIQLLGRFTSINVRKVMWLADEIGVAYERTDWGNPVRDPNVPEFLALNPNGLVPVIIEDDFVLWESNAILQYAADKIGNEAVYPRDLKTRADINRWLLWESSSWFPSCYVFLVENCVKPLLGGAPDPAILDGQAAQFHKLAGILDARLAKNRWVAGTPGPTIADIALAAPMHLHGWQKLPLSDHPNLKRWMGDVEALPSWKKTWVGEGFTTRQAA
jgi:glutathione S-transferase